MASSALCASAQPWQQRGGSGEKRSVSSVSEAQSGQRCRHAALHLTHPIT